MFIGSACELGRVVYKEKPKTARSKTYQVEEMDFSIKFPKRNSHMAWIIHCIENITYMDQVTRCENGAGEMTLKHM